MNNNEKKLISRDELKQFILNHCVNEDGDIDLSNLDFSDFDGDIDISHLKCNGRLFQNYQKSIRGIFQNNQKTSGFISQQNQKALNVIQDD